MGVRAAVVAAVLVAVGSWATVPDAGAVDPPSTTLPATVTLSLTPDSGLVDGQQVAVSADADRVLGIGQCPAGFGTFDYDRCVPVAVADPGLSSDLALSATIDHNWSTTTDCRTSPCELVAVDIAPASDYVIIGRVALDLDPAAPLRPPPSVTVSPAGGLIDGDAVTVGVTGARSDHVVASQCAGTPTFADQWSRCTYLGDAAAPDGPTEVAVQAYAYVETSTGPVDCRTAPGTCRLDVWDGVRGPVFADLAFDPGGPVAPRLLQRPTTGDVAPGLLDGVGFTPGDTARLVYCNGAGKCSAQVLATAIVTGGGEVLALEFGDSIPLPDDISCTVAVNGCAPTLLDEHGRRASADFYLIAGPDGPFRSDRLPVRVTPHSGLHDGDEVTVQASGFTPGASLTVVTCSGAAFTLGPDQCDPTTSTLLDGQQVTAGPDGSVQVPYTIRRTIDLPGGPFDCATGNVDPDEYDALVAAGQVPDLAAPGRRTCVVAVANAADYGQSGAEPIAFEGAVFEPLSGGDGGAGDSGGGTSTGAVPVAATASFTG